MKTPNRIEAEVDAIRDQIWEEIKDMTPAEEVEYFNRETADVIRQYGFRTAQTAYAESEYESE